MASPKNYSSLDLAKMFLVRAQAEGRKLNQMALQRLVYYCACHYAKSHGRALLDEPLWAVSFGPVIESLFHALLKHELEPVTLHDLGTGSLPVHLESDSELVAVVDSVWRRYGHRDAIWLSNFAHASGSPWDLTYNGLRAPTQEAVEIEVPTILMGFKALELPEDNRSSYH